VYPFPIPDDCVYVGYHNILLAIFHDFVQVYMPRSGISVRVSVCRVIGRSRMGPFMALRAATVSGYEGHYGHVNTACTVYGEANESGRHVTRCSD
jgi:hypothetical protein